MKLHYIEQGSGEPMVLLHGNGEDNSYFDAQLRYFSKKYRVIAVDTRGHGKSPRGVKPFTLKQFSRDLKEFLDQMELKRVILLGFSDGGNIALIFALRYPGYVDRLILNGANLNPFGMKPCVLASITFEYALVSVKLCLAKLRAGELCAATKRTVFLKRKKELLGLMAKEPWIPGKKLRELAPPVLVLAGTKDLIRRKHTVRIHRLLSGSRLRLIEGDHFILKGNSRASNRAINHFLEITDRGVRQSLEL